MKFLGNARIGSGKRGIKIFKPDAAAGLLDTAIEAAKNNRRVVYFCSCGAPIGCHRRTVARLVREAGEDRGIHVCHVEWPGGEPVYIDIEVSREIYAKAEQDRARVPLPRDSASLRTLPWYSVVSLRSKADKQRPPIQFFTGPARFLKGTWCLPVWENGWDSMGKSAALEQAKKWRARHGYAAF
jgi:hypothetical protein